MLSEAWASDPDWGLAPVADDGHRLPPRRSERAPLARTSTWAAALLRIERSNAQPKAGVQGEGDQDAAAATRQHSIRRHVDMLAAHRERCEQRCAALGCDLEPTAFLFSPAPDGSTPWPPRTLTQRYGYLARKLKLRSTRLHSLAALLSDRAHRGRCRHPHCRRAPRPRQRRSDNAQDLRGVG